MIIDKLGTFANDTSIGGGTGRRRVGDEIDLGAGNLRDIGSGEDIFLVLQVAAPFVGAGASVAFELVSDAQVPITADGTETVHAVTRTIPVAQLVAGATVAVMRVPMGAPNYERFLGLNANVTGAAFSSGSVHGFMTKEPARWYATNDAVN